MFFDNIVFTSDITQDVKENGIIVENHYNYVFSTNKFEQEGLIYDCVNTDMYHTAKTYKPATSIVSVTHKFIFVDTNPVKEIKIHNSKRLSVLYMYVKTSQKI